jgi:hypothetical protein
MIKKLKKIIHKRCNMFFKSKRSCDDCDQSTCDFKIVMEEEKVLQYDKEINEIALDMQNRLIEKHQKHGDSWKTDLLVNLRSRLIDKWERIISINKIDETTLLIDLMNQAGLLYLRLKELKKPK